MAMIWCFVLVALLYLLQRKLRKSKNNMKLPPGPTGFPIFGSLHLLGKHPHHDLQKLAQKYGPIMHIRLGLTPTIIVSSPQAAELFLKTHDLVFASRPPLEAAKYMTWDQKDLVFAPYGSYWRDMRKMCTLELLNSVKISSFMGMRREEMGLFLESLREAARVGDVVDLSAKVSALTADMSCRMVFGKKYSDAGFVFKETFQEALHLTGIPNVADYIPFLAPFDVHGYTKRMKRINKVVNEFLEKIIDEHIRSKDEDGRTKDFVSVMLSLMGSHQSDYKIEMPNIKAITMDMLVGAMDTSATAIEWAMSELIKNPRMLKNLREELEVVAGSKRVVEESDLENLDYLDMVVKETLRLHPVGPLLIPHMASKDCSVNDYHIPRKSHILINAYAIGRDPNAWTDPETFIPERFVGSDVDVRGRDFQLIPFGAGRRGCPGLQLGLLVFKLVVANLVHCFDWKLPNGVPCSELDMDKEFGLTTPRANHLMVVPTYRIKN